MQTVWPSFCSFSAVRTILCLALFSSFIISSSAERINQEGRLLGTLPTLTNPILFNTTNADAVLSAMQIFPVTNAWNEDISLRPTLINSTAMIAQISADLASNRQTLRAFYEMNFVLVPNAQPLLPITFVDYPDESEPGPYPLPSNLPIEGWPIETGGETLAQAQADTLNLGGDRHAIIVQPSSGILRETWQAKLVGTRWEASNGAQFDLKSNALRPDGWTSGDAAGLPMFPALVRFDECERGMVEHAMRLVVKRSRKAHIYPATHDASTTAATQTNVPAMGQRLRLKSTYVIPANWTKQEKAVLLALKKYGGIVADNGGFMSFSVTPDDRWPNGAFDHLSSIGVTNFEVIQTTGPNEGPRAPGAPIANAGADQSAALGTPIQLRGSVTYSGTRPAMQWKCYSGPGTVSFGNSTQTNTAVTVSAPGVYTFLLSAGDNLHAPAYDAMTVNVTAQPVLVSISRSGTHVILNWTGQAPPYVVEQCGSLQSPWTSALTTSVQTATFPIASNTLYFRIRNQLP